jgi:GNAT superfamily N-acetyltransferase
MPTSFHTIIQDDTNHIALISDWYQKEWNIPKEKTTDHLSGMKPGTIPFQIMMYVDGKPVATGGVYDHVGLLDKEPRFKVYPHWLALMYTIPSERSKGYGRILSEEILKVAKASGLHELYLFTDTAESLYKRVGWEVVERLTVGPRNIVVMKLEL